MNEDERDMILDLHRACVDAHEKASRGGPSSYAFQLDEEFRLTVLRVWADSSECEV